jgi:hypothetical protein
MYVYHDTAAHIKKPDNWNLSFILALANRPFNALVGKSERNQITQGAKSIPVVWTAFSPLWARFSIIHRQAQGSEWPELVRGLELRSSREILQRFTKQFWHTVWFGQGIQPLNSRHQQSLAINYILTPVSSS